MTLTKKDKKLGYIYIELSDGGFLRYKQESTQSELEIEYKRLLREIVKHKRPYIELKRGHAIFIDHIIEILIRYD